MFNQKIINVMRGGGAESRLSTQFPRSNNTQLEKNILSLSGGGKK